MEPNVNLIDCLGKVLTALEGNPSPHLPNPEGCRKRASVAVILRVRKAFSAHSQPPNPPNADIRDLQTFFSQEWVRGGDPEVLFIKRAGRKGDRWSGHTALPGGRRDPGDTDDLAAAVRETREEIGLDLTTPECLLAGNLPERVVVTTWGKESLMVLCPYLFIMTGKNIPPLQPQPTEVAAIHWVPLRALLSSTLRTSEFVDVSSRFARQGGPVLRVVLRLLLGKMIFSAVRLIPSESLYASSTLDLLPPPYHLKSVFSQIIAVFTGAKDTTSHPEEPLLQWSSLSSREAPLLLWGLTLGVLADFLDMLPPHTALKLWRYPTFTPPDLQLIIYLLTRSLRQNNAGHLSSGTWPSQTAVDLTTQAVAINVSEAEPMKFNLRKNDVGISGLGVGSNPKEAAAKLLSGYYERLDVAIGIFLVYRFVLGSTAAAWFYRFWRNRRP